MGGGRPRPGGAGRGEKGLIERRKSAGRPSFSILLWFLAGPFSEQTERRRTIDRASTPGSRPGRGATARNRKKQDQAHEKRRFPARDTARPPHARHQRSPRRSAH